MLTNSNISEEFQRLSAHLIEIIRVERDKILELHSDHFVRSPHNFKHCHARLITQFTLNSYDKDHKTLLHKAVKCGNHRLVYFLVDYYGALINTCDLFGHTPLFAAIKEGYWYLAKFLISRGALLNYTVLKRMTSQNTDEAACFTQTSLFNYILRHLDCYFKENENPESVARK